MTKQKPYTVHFVCRGNTYRSRLAAAYMRSIAGERFTVSSSGVDTRRTNLKTSETYTQVIARRHKLTYGIMSYKTQTSNELLARADILVFMHKDVYEEALKKYDFDARKAIIWQVADISRALRGRYDNAHQDVALVERAAEHAFKSIQGHCDELLHYITQTGWVDITDAANRSSGIRLPINWATDRGLWHRGIHVIAQTTDGKFIVGKRSDTIVFAPGMLEITLGGAVDSGEQPLAAAQRETQEELGVRLPAAAFKPLFTYRKNHYHPRYGKQSRNHMYVYSVTLPVHSSRLTPQPGEVAELRLLSKRQVQHVLRTHRMIHFGRLKEGRELYRRALRQGIAVF